MRYSKEAVQESLKTLREVLKPGDTVYCILHHVSRSGMQLEISLLTFKNNEPYYLSYHAARVLGWSSTNKGAVKVTGAGMDMGFHLVYSLSRELFCDVELRMEDPGYLLTHRWL